MANHLRLDLHLVELLAGVDTDDAADHLGNNNHVTEVSLDEIGLLVGLSLLLGLAELLDEAHGAALKTTVDLSAGTSVDDIAELVGGQVKETVADSRSALCSGPSNITIPQFPKHSPSYAHFPIPKTSSFSFEHCRILSWGSVGEKVIGSRAPTHRDRHRGKRTCGRFSSS